MIYSHGAALKKNRKRPTLQPGETDLACPYCDRHPLWVYYAGSSVYLGCAAPDDYGCPEATPPCQTIAQARAFALELGNALKALRTLLHHS